MNLLNNPSLGKYFFLALVLCLAGLLSGCNTDLLHKAAADGDIAKLNSLIVGGTDVNAKDNRGTVPLCKAVWNKHVDAVKILIDNGADANMYNYYGDRLLHYAASRGLMDIAEILIAGGAEIDERSLVVASEDVVNSGDGRYEMVKLLIANGADVKKHGPAALLRAVALGHKKVAKLLLTEGAAPTAKGKLYQMTALHHAASRGDKDIVKLLIAHGADVNAESSRDGRKGITPLYHAAEYGHMEVVELLIKSGAEVKPEAVYYAVLSGRENTKAIVELLIVNSASFDIKSKSANTTLLLAAVANRKDIAELLIAKGAIVDLHISAYLGDLAWVKNLVKQGADINAYDVFGRTPLFVAAKRRQREMVEFLIDKGADINSQNERSSVLTPLHASVKGLNTPCINRFYPIVLLPQKQVTEKSTKSKPHIAELLIAKGADVNAKDYGGNTPLHYSYYNEEIRKMLIDNGADVNARNKSGDTPKKALQKSIRQMKRRKRGI